MSGGVEFRTISSCVERIGNIRWSDVGENKYRYIDLTSVDISTNAITDTQTIDSDTAPSRAQQIVRTNDILIGTTRPMLKRYCFVPPEHDGDICSTGFCVLRVTGDDVLPRYLYHVITSNAFFAYVEKRQRGAAYPAISDANIKDYKFSVPTLEVQQEIVDILDKFTELISLLQRELELRKKQYEYYRDKLINADYPQVRLSDIAKIKRGVRVVRSQLARSGEYPVYQNSLTPLGYYDKCNRAGGQAFVISAGAAGDIGFSYGDFWAADDCFCFECSDSIDLRYLYYALQSQHELIASKVRRASVPRLSREYLENLLIPLPPLERQQEISSTLDKFNTLCTSHTEGITAEIEARKKQYEYYRDKLLTL